MLLSLYRACGRALITTESEKRGSNNRGNVRRQQTKGRRRPAEATGKKVTWRWWDRQDNSSGLWWSVAKYGDLAQAKRTNSHGKIWWSVEYDDLVQTLINRQRYVLNVSVVMGSIPLTLIKGCGDVLKIKNEPEKCQMYFIISWTTFDMIMIPMSCTICLTNKVTWMIIRLMQYSLY